MASTKVSSRGQVVLPASIRARKGWGPGTELEVVDRGNEVVLRRRSRRAELYPPITMEEALARLPRYEGPPVSDEEIETELAQYIRRDWWRENGGRYVSGRPFPRP